MNRTVVQAQIIGTQYQFVVNSTDYKLFLQSTKYSNQKRSILSGANYFNCLSVCLSSRRAVRMRGEPRSAHALGGLV